MNDIVLGNRSQPIGADVLLEIMQMGHLIISKGAEGISCEKMEVLEPLEATFIWPAIKRALMASIDREASQWNAYHSQVLAALFRGGIGKIQPAGEGRDTTVWKAALRTAFQSLIEKAQAPTNQAIPHRSNGHVCDLFRMAVDTVEWLSQMLSAPMMWANIPG